MIRFTKGDMFNVSVDIRVNTVNCHGVMGAGVALVFKNRYPDMYRAYGAACRAGELAPGKLHVWTNPSGDWIINFPTKRHWREHSRYEDIAAGLSALRDYLADKGPVKVALPALGCGNGKLDWKTVAPMISTALDGLDAEIVVFEPASARRAGVTTAAEASDDAMRAVEARGFVVVDLPSRLSNGSAPTAAFLRGAPEPVMNAAWIAVLASRQPGTRELAALGAIASQMACQAVRPTVALVRSSPALDAVATIFSAQGIAVVLILPPGPLASAAELAEHSSDQQGHVTMISVAGATAAWSEQHERRAEALLHLGAVGALLSDPAPDWLNRDIVQHWNRLPFFYLRYGDADSNGGQLLRAEGIRSIGRRPDTGKPHLEPLLAMARPA